MRFQATHQQNIFSSVEEMDNAVQAHIYHNATKLSDNYKNILRLLASYSLKTLGTCRLKVSTIAKEVGCSEVTVNRAIKRLKALNIIDVQQGTKLNGIQGANYYSILNFNHVMTERVQQREMTERATHETPRSSKVQHAKSETESFNSFNLSFNPVVSNNVINNVNASATGQDLKEILKTIYNPQCQQSMNDFEELCKIAFGRIKQFMKSHNMPYLQMIEIVIRCMKSLINKTGVKNQFAMYSKMVERQVLQLFENFVQPQSKFNKQFNESIPDWFEKRNEQPQVQQTNESIDFEAERAKILAKLGC